MGNRDLTLKIFRHDPQDARSQPHLQEYKLKETPRMTLYTVLSLIREEQDPSLHFDFVCRSAVCGSCAMLVNGRPRLACQTRTAELPSRITLMPLPFFKLVHDLSVDTGVWFREMGRRVQSWIEKEEPFSPAAEEERITDAQAQAIYELDRCIECGCCIAACGAAQMRYEFIGAAGMVRIVRFMIDPRDERSPARYYELVGSDHGIFGCIGLMACDDYCPKEIPIAAQLAYVRRRLVAFSLSPISRKQAVK